MDYSKLGQAAAKSDDLTVKRETARELPKEGMALLRLRDYIELGRHEAKNPQHKPSLKVMLTFELSHPKHMIEIDGKKVPSTITVRVNKTYSDKGKYIPLFNAMNRCFGKQYNHFVEMINKPMIAEIYHNKSEDGKTTYANLDIDGSWSFKEAAQIDAITETKTPVPVPELDGIPKVFLWEADGMSDEDILEMWESIYIEGTRTNEKNEEVSKNWIQESVMENIEWEGSTVQALTQEHVSLDEPEESPKKDSLAANASGNVPNLDD